ncbi:MAG TPA: glycosyltransferase family 2 protein [Nitrospiria bacterium]|nr:glycosyltransferase family 2 protein [Nitrospiria bacterium]
MPDREPKRPALSIVIPLFNEAESLPALAERVFGAVARYGLDAEVLFVDDGSTDGSEGIYRRLCDVHPALRVIRLRRNFGQTAAMAAGFDHARGAVIVVLDGDLQNDPDDIPLLLKKLDEGFDVVSGWRRDRRDHWSRVLPSRLANWLIGRTTGVRLHDYGCSLKAYRAELIQNIPLYGDLHRFIPALAGIYGAKITELPVRHHPRAQGRSKYTLARTFRVIMDLIIVSFLKSYAQRPMHAFGWAGILMMVTGFGIEGYLAIQKLAFGAQLAGRPLLLFGAVLMLAGLQIASLGILAELQIRTYHESQGKPIYTVREVIASDRNAPG